MSSLAEMTKKLVLLFVIVVPILAIPVGVYQVWGWGVDWPSSGLFVGFYVLTGFGITVGYHRLFTHKSFEAVRPLKIFLAIAGSMALEGPVITWVARHNKHHRFSDQEGDPHSPLEGFWHAHFGFLFTEESPDKERYAKHLLADSDIVWVSRLFPLWALLSLALPTLAGWIMSGSLAGAFLGLLWGGFIRIGLVHHVTWSINSVCHVFGTRRFRTQDQSRNNRLCGLLGGGEGWHNNHHAFPTSAWHSLGQGFDASYWLIKVFVRLGLADKVRLPSESAILSKEVH